MTPFAMTTRVISRKVHNSIFAATASAFLLVFGLISAGPDRAQAVAATRTPAPAVMRLQVNPSPDMLRDARAQARADAMEARIEARASAFEAEMDRTAGSASIGDTVASAMAFAAEISTEVALTSALGAFDGSSGRLEVVDDGGLADEQRRHARRVRGALAVPYFSFAQGMRGTGS